MRGREISSNVCLNITVSIMYATQQVLVYWELKCTLSSFLFVAIYMLYRIDVNGTTVTISISPTTSIVPTTKPLPSPPVDFNTSTPGLGAYSAIVIIVVILLVLIWIRIMIGIVIRHRTEV